jgi:cysteine-rich repeat protein
VQTSSGEQCDAGAGNAQTPDAPCRLNCVLPHCGDAVRDDSAGEVCDDGNNLAGDGCAPDCRGLETCGDERVDPGEECDQGPAQSRDGCASVCLTESPVWTYLYETYPSRISSTAVVFTSTWRSIYMFGGSRIDRTAPNDDFWEFTGWSWHQPPTLVRPEPREGHAMAFDSARGVLVLFGGRAGTTTLFGDTWEYDGVTWARREPLAAPSARYGHGMTYDSGRGRIVLLGGTTDLGNDSSFTGEVWTWDGVTWAREAAELPPYRFPGIAYDPGRGITVAIASDATGNFPTVWERAAGVWQAVSTLTLGGPYGLVYSPTWQAVVRTSHSAATESWDGASWTARGPAVPSSQSSGQPAIAVDPATGRPMTFATGWDGYFRQLDGLWQPAFPEKPIGPFDAAFDQRRGVLVVKAADGETWEWSEGAWARRATGASTLYGLFYDDRRGRLLAFGYSPDALYAWDGASWVVVPGADPPPPCGGPYAYDTLRGRLVLRCIDPNQTWEFDVTNDSWVQAAAAPPPPTQRPSSMTFDPIRGVSVVLQFDGAIWQWDGTSWSPHPMGGLPDGLFAGVLGFHPRRGRVVLVGGSIFIAQQNAAETRSTYEFDGTQWNRLPISDLTTSSWTDRALALPSRGLLVITHDGFQVLSFARQDIPVESCISETVDADIDGLAGCADPDCAPRCQPLCVRPPCATTGPRCGDATCSPVEDYLICPADCPTP